MKDFLKQLLPQNYPFLASLFQAELLKHALNADEFDKQLAELTDPTKLRKLNQRMTERRADNSQNYSAKQQKNGGNNNGNSNYNNNSRPPPQQYKHKGITYFNTNSSSSNTKGQFKPRTDKEVSSARSAVIFALKKFDRLLILHHYSTGIDFCYYSSWKKTPLRDCSWTRKKNSFKCSTRSITTV
jgi:hypothetical protein